MTEELIRRFPDEAAVIGDEVTGELGEERWARAEAVADPDFVPAHPYDVRPDCLAVLSILPLEALIAVAVLPNTTGQQKAREAKFAAYKKYR